MYIGNLRFKGYRCTLGIKGLKGTDVYRKCPFLNESSHKIALTVPLSLILEKSEMQFETDDDDDDRDYTGYIIILILTKLKMFIQWDPKTVDWEDDC